MAKDERQLLALLREKEIPYKMVLIDEDDDAKQQMRARGVKRLPQLHANGHRRRLLQLPAALAIDCCSHVCGH